MKKIWLSALDSCRQEVPQTRTLLQKYGLEVDGHFWQDDPAKMAWAAPRPSLVDKKSDLWAILASSQDLSTPSIRYGLALLALTIQAANGHDFPIVIMSPPGQTIAHESLPTPLCGSNLLALDNPTCGAKIVAWAHKHTKKSLPPYRLDVYGIPQIGQWFEVGPRDERWAGALFGTCGAEPCLHTVGAAGQLPEKSVLHFPQRGLEIDCQGQKFTAWAVQNDLDPASSYYIKVDGQPEAILFSAYSTGETPEVFVLRLK